MGIVDIDVSGKYYAFVAPPTKIAPLAGQNLQMIVDALAIPTDAILHTAQLDNGPVWQALHLSSAAHVLALDSSCVNWASNKSVGLIGAHPAGSECDFEVRMLAPSSGMSEDPITGSLNAALAHWLQATGQLTHPITVAQGTNINRHGRVSIHPNNASNSVLIGGDTHIIIEGTVTL